MRAYTIPMASVLVTVAQDLWEILTPSLIAVKLKRIKLTQYSDTDSEQLHITLSRVTGAPTSGSGGLSVTPVPLSPGDVASGCTCKINNTTVLTGGTKTLLEPEGQNILQGYDHQPVPDDMHTFAPATRILVRLEAAPIDELALVGYMIVEEIP